MRFGGSECFIHTYKPIKFGSQYGGLFENAWMSNLGNIWGAVRISIPDLDNQETFTHTVLVCECMWTSTIPGDNIKTIKHQSTAIHVYIYMYTYLSIDPLSFRNPDGRSPLASPIPRYDWMKTKGGSNKKCSYHNP